MHMAENFRPILKKIDEVCKPIFELGGEKGVAAKDLEKRYNKGPLSQLAYDLFSCLYDTKRQLTAVLKAQERKILELGTSLSEKENEIIELSSLDDIMGEVKKNGDRIAELKEILEEKSERIVSEAKKVSSYADILQKSSCKTEKKQQGHNLQPEKFAKRVVADIKASEKRRNLVVYGVTGDYNRKTKNYDFEEQIGKMLPTIGLENIQIASISVISKRDSEDLARPSYTLRVQLHEEFIAAKILRNAWRLKGTCYGNMYIAPDRTLEEQKQWSKLVKELKSQIEKSPHYVWKIRGGKVINSGAVEYPVYVPDSD